MVLLLGDIGNSIEMDHDITIQNDKINATVIEYI